MLKDNDRSQVHMEATLPKQVGSFDQITQINHLMKPSSFINNDHMDA